jgi:GntR family transcriptional regulator of vanillate catabolism
MNRAMTQLAEDAPERAPTRSISVADRIRSAVLSGDFAPGARLHEVRLSDLLGVSRTPIRSALQMLASEGLLDYAPNRGYSVRAFQISEIIDAYDIRANLEAMTAKFAAERGLTDVHRRGMETALARGDALLTKAALTDLDRIEFGEINFILHNMIHEAARCRTLGEMLRICERVPQSSLSNVVAFEFINIVDRHDDHHKIYDAILSRDARRAEALMREHVASIKTGLVRSLTGREPTGLAERIQAASGR